jgi:hypothetical protein
MFTGSLAAAGTAADANATPAIMCFIVFSMPGFFHADISTFVQAGWRVVMPVDNGEYRE